MQIIQILIQQLIRYWWIVVLIVCIRWGGLYITQWVSDTQLTQTNTIATISIVPTAIGVVTIEPTTTLQPHTPTISKNTRTPVTEATYVALDYVPGMQLSSFDDFHIALLTAFRQNQEQFTATFTGNNHDLDSVYSWINNYYDPHRRITIDSALPARSTTIRINIKYAPRDDNAVLVHQRVSTLVKSLIVGDMSPHQKVRVLHDWVVRNTKYDDSLTRYTAYDILVEGTAVCQGYALLMDALLTEAGFNTIFVTGNIKPEFRVDTNSTSDGGHAWNMVQIDGHWYHLDATWDDPAPDQPNQVQYDYYMLTDAEIGVTRTFDNEASNYLRPIATTSYADALQAALVSDVNHTTELHQIIKDTYVQYINNDTLFSASDLQRFTTYIDQFTDTPFVFRAVNESAVSQLIEHYAQLKGAQVRYSYGTYPRTLDPDDVLVQVFVIQQIVEDTYPQYSNDDVLFSVSD